MDQKSFYLTNDRLQIEQGCVTTRSVSYESMLIAGICMLDLVTTLFWVSQGMAREANPLMNHFLEMGAAPFVLVKVLTFMPAIVAAEWYRPHNPRLVLRTMRWAIFIYVSAYLIGVLGHHGNALHYYRSLVGDWF